MSLRNQFTKSLRASTLESWIQVSYTQSRSKFVMSISFNESTLSRTTTDYELGVGFAKLWVNIYGPKKKNV